MVIETNTLQDTATLVNQAEYLATQTPEGRRLKAEFPNISNDLLVRATHEMWSMLGLVTSDGRPDAVIGANDALWDPDKRTFRGAGSDLAVTLAAACAHFNYKNGQEGLPDVNRQRIAGPEGDPNSEVVMQVADFIHGVVAEQYAGMQQRRLDAAPYCAHVKP